MDSKLHQEFYRTLGFDTEFVDVSELVEKAEKGENRRTRESFGQHIHIWNP